MITNQKLYYKITRGYKMKEKEQKELVTFNAGDYLQGVSMKAEKGRLLDKKQRKADKNFRKARKNRHNW